MIQTIDNVSFKLSKVTYQNSAGFRFTKDNGSSDSFIDRLVGKVSVGQTAVKGLRNWRKIKSFSCQWKLIFISFILRKFQHRVVCTLHLWKTTKSQDMKLAVKLCVLWTSVASSFSASCRYFKLLWHLKSHPPPILHPV